MIGTIERIKNDLLMKCNNLNEKVISESLPKIIDSNIYHFNEELMNLYIGLNIGFSEDEMRNNIDDIIKIPILKKIKRKLFIDSLAIQITNDYYIESFLNNEIDINKIEKEYINELRKNKSSNQLNMTEDLDITIIIDKLRRFVDEKIKKNIAENIMLVQATTNSLNNFERELQIALNNLIDECDNNYMKYLLEDLKDEKCDTKDKSDVEKKEIERWDENMYNETTDSVQENNDIKIVNKFEKYDDMTLFNKVILSLNTKEEKLSRKEKEINNKKEEVDKRLESANKSIEFNIERENKLTQKKLELNSKEVEINSKLSEAEVIFLNIKPLLKGLNSINSFKDEGGNR